MPIFTITNETTIEDLNRHHRYTFAVRRNGAIVSAWSDSYQTHARQMAEQARDALENPPTERHSYDHDGTVLMGRWSNDA